MTLFRERYSHEVPSILKFFGVTRICEDSIEFKWGYFAPRFGLELMLNRGGYFDQRYAISFCLIWGRFHIKMPFKTRIPESCDSPRYGVQIHDNTFWFHLGGEMNDWEQCDSKWLTWYLPWFSWVFDIHEVWTDEGWVEAGRGEYSSPYSDDRVVETHPYSYALKNGEAQSREAVIFKERRKWHRKWFPFIKMIRETISVDFSDEVGEKTGSWKGGCTGCGYDLKKGETMLSCLRRMEAERKF